MSKSKQDKLLPFAYDPVSAATHPLNQCQDIADNLASTLLIKHVANYVCTMKRNYVFYKPLLEKKKKAEQALTHVVRGNVISLIALIKNNLIEFPSLVFERYPQITAPRGQTYYNVSAYQLMTFLCDADMKKQIMKLIPEQFNALRQAQYAAIDCGGADIIKLDRNPIDVVKEQGFEGVLHYKTTIDLFDGTPPEVTLPLLQNPNGIICYQDANNKKHFFYANQENQSVLTLEGYIVTEENKEAFEQFKESFDHMEPNSGRRSNEEEHQLIAKVLAISLVRKGIFYTDKKDILYRDSCTPFNLTDAYIKCIRLYDEAELNGNWKRAHQSWYADVGTAQGEEIWLLQRICEKGKPFHPLNYESFADFKRGQCMIYNDFDQSESVFDEGILKISDCAVYKDLETELVRKGRVGREGLCWTSVCTNFVVVCWLIEDARANVIEFKPEHDVCASYTIR